MCNVTCLPPETYQPTANDNAAAKHGKIHVRIVCFDEEPVRTDSWAIDPVTISSYSNALAEVIELALISPVEDAAGDSRVLPPILSRSTTNGRFCA